jgi:uncharacterized 2Fe-2S/4Fe-4S cluster protein (DUF4445 family)
LARYGIAIDLGTSVITGRLVDKTKVITLVESTTHNPQAIAGADVISRIYYQSRSGYHPSLTELVRSVVNILVYDLASSQAIDPDDIDEIVLVGNSVMHHLFLGYTLESLLHAPFLLEQKGTFSAPAGEVGLHVCPKAEFYSPPLVESFIGNDLLAALVDTCYSSDCHGALVLDIGTNTEIAFVSDTGIVAASAASGPAFEGMSLECGVQAVPGAIVGCSIDKTSYRPTCTTVADEDPTGICGTGSVSLLAALVDSGILNEVGSFRRDIGSCWVDSGGSMTKYLLTEDGRVFLTQQDVRMLQQSKASIRAAIEIVLEKSGAAPPAISRLVLTGAFGSGLDVRAAYRIGMLPALEHTNVVARKNSALEGATWLLYDEKARSYAQNLAENITYIDLMLIEGYDETHVKHLYLRPTN